MLFANMVQQLSYDFHQLPEDSLPSLRDSLIQLFIASADGPKPVMVQISLALASLALQFTSWKPVLEDLTAACSQSKTSFVCLLQFLSILPEEVSETKRVSLSV
jgi:transportin-3